MPPTKSDKTAKEYRVISAALPVKWLKEIDAMRSADRLSFSAMLRVVVRRGLDAGKGK